MNLEKPAGYEEMAGSSNSKEVEVLREIVAHRVENLNNELIQSIVLTVSGLEIESVDGDGMVPDGYFRFRLSMDKRPDITGTPFQSAANALQDFLDYAIDVVRDAAEIDEF